MKTKRPNPIRLVYVALALPADISFEKSGIMDSLSDLRDSTPGVKLLEWAQAPHPKTGERSSEIVDGETSEMLELFDSCRVSPGAYAPPPSEEFCKLANALAAMPQKPSDWSADNPDAVRAYDEALSLWRFQCCELAGLRAEG